MSVFQKFFGCCEKPEEQKEIYNNDQEIKTRTNSKGSPNLGTGDNSILNQSKASSNNKKAYSLTISKQNESNLKSESIIENSISSGGQLHLEDNFFPVNNNMSIEKVKTKTVTNKDNSDYFYSKKPSSILREEKNKITRGSILNIDLCTSDIILDDEIELAPKLKIKGKGDKDDLFRGETLFIDAAGEKKSLRNKRDGVTFFGVAEKENDSSYLNDVIINFPYTTTSKRIFAIVYNRKSSNYYLYNLNNDFKSNQFLFYVKINHDYIIDNPSQNETTTIHFLLGHLLTSLTISPIQSEQSELNIKIYMDKSKTSFQEFKFTNKNSPITIGRDNCTICIDNKYLSRIHCTISYDKYKKEWSIYDGNMTGRHSFHGTWLILNSNSKYKLSNVDDLYEVRIGNSSFSIELLNE